MLLFKKKFLPAIRAGAKTQTIRLWPWRRMRGGQRSYIPGVGYIRVDSVEEVRLETLTDEDAIPDGFDSAAELRDEIESLYVDQIAAGYTAFRVSFHVIDVAAQKETRTSNPASREARRPRKA